jgi:signal transduction histidine kinase
MMGEASRDRSIVNVSRQDQAAPALCRLVMADADGRVLSHAADLWDWLRCDPPDRNAGGPLRVADIAARLRAGMAMQAMAMDDGTIGHVILGADLAAADAVARENRLLRETLDAVDGSIVVHDSALRFRLGNKGYHEWQPHLPPDEELVGKHFADVLRMSIAAGSFADPRALTDTEAYVAERVAQVARREDQAVNHYQASKARWSQMRVRWTPSGNRVTLRVDITENKRLEEEMVRTQRIRTVGRISGGVAHHFNNLLTVICGCLDLLLQQAGLSARGITLVERALASAEQGGRLTQQLLTFAQRDITRPRRIDPNRFLDGIAALLQGALGSRVTLDLRLDGAAGDVLVDPAKFETAMMNLILNARDAIAARREGGAVIDGRVEIRTGLAIEDGRRFRLIAVADNGEGIRPEVAAEAFEPFFTTRHMGAASGLGLSQVHGFATGAGGHARISGTPGAGAVVEILLPVEGG